MRITVTRFESSRRPIKKQGLVTNMIVLRITIKHDILVQQRESESLQAPSPKRDRDQVARRPHLQSAMLIKDGGSVWTSARTNLFCSRQLRLVEGLNMASDKVLAAILQTRRTNTKALFSSDQNMTSRSSLTSFQFPPTKNLRPILKQQQPCL